MAKVENKSSTILSIILHIGLLILLYYFGKPATILIPSRSNGIEVSLVSMPAQTIPPTVPKVAPVTTPPVQMLNTPSEINVKENKPEQQTQPLPKVEAVPKVETPPVKQTTNSDNHKEQPTTTAKPKTTKNDRAVINDLLGDVMSKNDTSVRKGKALGGSANGTSDSNNLIGNYADQVINAVRPFVIIPEDISPNATAIVKVVLNPDLSVREITLLKSSNNANYDQSVQEAIKRVGIFPPLPEGAQFVDYRVLKLTFRPR